MIVLWLICYYSVANSFVISSEIFATGERRASLLGWMMTAYGFVKPVARHAWYIFLRTAFLSTARFTCFLATTHATFTEGDGAYATSNKGDRSCARLPKFLKSYVCSLSFFGGMKYYTESFFRPWLRRRAITFFPPFVAIRTRKPWVVARFFFLGLYVIDMWALYEKTSIKSTSLFLLAAGGLLPTFLFYFV